MASIDNLQFIGQSLDRPECVLTTRDGSIYTSHWSGGGVTHIQPNGQQVDYLPKKNHHAIRTNGFAITADRDFLIANLGDDGGVWQLTRQGQLTPYLCEIDQTPLPPTNYVHIDKNGRIWISISTRQQPRQLAYNAHTKDGFIILIDDRGARVVADNIAYTNEVVVSPCGKWLYVNETFGKCLSRFPISSANTLGLKEVVANFGPGTFPDGLCFDVEGNIWVTSILSNRVIRVTPEGKQSIILEENDIATLTQLEDTFQKSGFERTHLDNIQTPTLKNISSLAFGGEKQNIAYLGCLLGNQIAYFTTNTQGAKTPHW